MGTRVIELLACTLIAIGLAGCHGDPAPMGFSIDAGSGSIAIYPSLCEDDLVIAAGLSLDRPRRDGVEIAADGKLWEVRSERPLRIEKLVVGDTSPPFREIVGASPNLEDRAEMVWGYVLFMRGDSLRLYRSELYFSLLEVGVVHGNGERVQPSDWQEYVEDEFCN